MEKELKISLAEYEHLVHQSDIKQILDGDNMVMLKLSNLDYNRNGWASNYRNFYIQVMNPDETINNLNLRIEQVGKENERLNTIIKELTEKKEPVIKYSKKATKDYKDYLFGILIVLFIIIVFYMAFPK